MSPELIEKLKGLLILLQELSIEPELADNPEFEYVLDTFEDVDFTVTTVLDNYEPIKDKAPCSC